MGIIGVALLLATFIRVKVRFFQRFLIPNAITAGFIILFFYNFAAPKLGISQVELGAMVYHLLSISFISMTLRRTQSRGKRNSIFSMSVSVLSQYALQALLGLVITIVLISTLFPDLFPAFGFLLPLGFVLGPGQAYAIGSGWEGFGFAGAGSVGLTFAAVGFLWACFGGVFLINHGIKRGWMTREQLKGLDFKGVKTGIFPRDSELSDGSKLTTETEAIDSMTMNVIMVMVVYICTYLLLKLMTYLLSFAGSLGDELAVNLWGISFIFAALMAMIFRGFLKGMKVDHVLDNGSLTRISGTSIDIMVTAAIGAISLVIISQYWLPIVILCAVGGFVTIVTVPWICSRLFKDHKFHRTLIVYGASTGTMPTGLALLRVIDPEFVTPAASDYMFSCGYTFVMAIPFILAINLPVYARTTGNMLYFWAAVGVSAVYLIVVLILYMILSRKKAIARPSRIWLRPSKRQ